jgi:hypothetical protein
MATKKIVIKWTYPKIFDAAIFSDICCEGIGVYSISRQFGNNNTLLYIGKTYRKFRHRLMEHEKNWLNYYRGDKYVRFGIIISPRNLTSELVNDIESAIIYEQKPIANASKIKGYCYNDICCIENTGYRGTLPKKIDMNNH